MEKEELCIFFFYFAKKSKKQSYESAKISEKLGIIN